MASRLTAFLKEYKVLLIMLPAVAGIHYVWYKMQKSPVFMEGEKTKIFGKDLVSDSPK